MSLRESLEEVVEPHVALSRFGKAIPWDWIDEALRASGVATIRRRRPAEQVIWLVLGMALYRDRPISEVCESLDLALPPGNQGGPRIASSALCQARERVGEEPLRYLFLKTAEVWGEGMKINAGAAIGSTW